jgi:CubicO group peptidase (beta-lactamase class C family)
VKGFATANAVVREALGRRYSGAVLRVQHAGRPLFERAYGAVDDTPGAPAVELTTRFDLASIAKPFVATAVLQGVAAGRLDLDVPLSASVLPEWANGEKETISLRRLLAHDAGMQSGADYRQLFGENVERYSLKRPLVAPVGERVIYSDLGFIVVGLVLGRSQGEGLRAVLRSSLASLGCTSTAYRPRRAARSSIPATEDDGWRGRVRGFVHDEKAYLMGGVAGHAGLFGNAADVARLCEAYLAPLHGRAAPLAPSLARQALAQQAYDETLRRGLGWALKTRDDNSCGARMSRSTFGHTGFVGTVVWADPERDLSITFLTNAVYFGRSDLRDVRAAVCDAVTEEIDR